MASAEFDYQFIREMSSHGAVTEYQSISYFLYLQETYTFSNNVVKFDEKEIAELHQSGKEKKRGDKDLNIP